MSYRTSAYPELVALRDEIAVHHADAFRVRDQLRRVVEALMREREAKAEGPYPDTDRKTATVQRDHAWRTLSRICIALGLPELDHEKIEEKLAAMTAERDEWLRAADKAIAENAANEARALAAEARVKKLEADEIGIASKCELHCIDAKDEAYERAAQECDLEFDSVPTQGALECARRIRALKADK